MYIKLISLEIKNFIRNPQFGTDILIKILSFFVMLAISSVLFFLSFFMYYYPKEELNISPINFFASYFIYYWFFDLIFRYFIQQMPTQNIKPFLTIGIKKKKLVHYTIIKILCNFFNWGNLLFLVPFAALLIYNGDTLTINTVVLACSLLLIFYINNFINILLNGYTKIVSILIGLVTIAIALNYFNLIDLKVISETIILFLYNYPISIIINFIILILLIVAAYKSIMNKFYLDEGLDVKKQYKIINDIKYLERFGILGTFINNDIKLISRNQAAKSAFFGSIMFLAYGLLYYIPSYQSPFMQLFIGIFVSGNFMMLFGQKVPSWDSSYFPLLMTQKIHYIKYLEAKWTLIVISIIISMIVSSVYIFISSELYLTILAAGLYNIGVNSYIVLMNGAFNKTGIDLNQSTKSFGGGKNNFNLKTILLSIPQLLLPMIVYGFANKFFNIYIAILSIAILGLIGFIFRNIVFNYIVKLYSKEKYTTLESFKKKI